MKEKVIRVLYLVLGAQIGGGAYSILNEATNVGFITLIILIALGIIISFKFKEKYLKTTTKEVIGLIVGNILCYPIAYVLYFGMAAVIFFIRLIL